MSRNHKPQNRAKRQTDHIQWFPCPDERCTTSTGERKRCYTDKRDAKRVAKRSTEALHHYPCPAGWGVHVGHLRPLVMYGYESRRDVYRQT